MQDSNKDDNDNETQDEKEGQVAINKVKFNKDNIAQLFPYKYNKESKQWCLSELDKIIISAEKKSNDNNDNNDATQDEKAKENEQVVVMSFNVWFSQKKFNQRQEKLVEILKEIKPDIFCFQEVIKDWVQNIVKIPFIQNNYAITDIPADLSSIGPYGVFIGINTNRFNVLDVKISDLESWMARKLLSTKIQLKTGSNDIFWINSVHLESKYSTDTRIKQLDTIFDKHMVNMGQLNEIFTSTIMLMGDFNFRDNPNKNNLNVEGLDNNGQFPENDHLKEDTFIDCWKQFCNDNDNMDISSGWTRRVGYRYDRILMNVASKYNIKDFKILGDAENEMPSDHKGVVVFLK